MDLDISWIFLGLPIAFVLGWLASGMSVEDIIEDYPELSIEKIRACLSFAADKEHKLKIAS